MRTENEFGILYHDTTIYDNAVKVYNNLRKQGWPNVTLKEVNGVWEIRYKWNETKKPDPEPQRVYSRRSYDYSDCRRNRNAAIRFEEQYHNPFTSNNTIHDKFYRYGDFGTWS